MKRFWVVLAVLAGAVSSLQGDDKAAVVLDDKEKAFAALLQDAVLVGNFTVNREKQGNDKSPERYGIKSIKKVADGQWMVNSHIKYGKLDMTVPVPVQVHFANDTPVLSVTDLSIPLVGKEFTARVMFFDNQYAGTWRHGKVTGLMFGRVERAGTEEKGSEDQPATSAEEEKVGKPAAGEKRSSASAGGQSPASSPSRQKQP